MKTPRSAVARSLVARSLQLDSVEASQQFAKEIAAYLVATRRTSELESLMRDISQFRADAGVVEVIARSAFQLIDTVESDIRREVQQLFPSATTVIISHKHDKSVVAGVKLEFANQQLDLSVRSQLNRMKQSILTQQDTRKES